MLKIIPVSEPKRVRYLCDNGTTRDSILPSFTGIIDKDIRTPRFFPFSERELSELIDEGAMLMRVRISQSSFEHEIMGALCHERFRPASLLEFCAYYKNGIPDDLYLENGVWRPSSLEIWGSEMGTNTKRSPYWTRRIGSERLALHMRTGKFEPHTEWLVAPLSQNIDAYSVRPAQEHLMPAV